jgi:hypothetical protein
MKKLIAILFCLTLTPALAKPEMQTVSMNEVVPNSDMLPKDAANITILDKASGKTKQLQIKTGTAAQFEKLNILVKSCLTTPEFRAEDFDAFFEISKTQSGSVDAQKIFSGWMIASTPGANPLQDENYDLWLNNCE